MNGHEFLADGSFGSADVCFGQTACEDTTGSGWKTILVGALGRAGPYLYGLDVTDATWTVPRWLWDINPDAKDYPGTPATTNLDSDSMNMGFATSAPVVARVRNENDPYTWGVFVGGGYPDITRDTSANNDCTDDSTMGYTEWENGNYFYVYDANPANRPGCPGLCGASPSLLYGAGHTARWCIRGVNKTGTSVDRMNGVPGRPGVVRQNSNSRASTVYFGDLDGKVWRMDVTSKHIANWTPRVWFNPYDQATDGSSIDSSCFMSPATSTNVQPAPDITGSPAARSMPLAVPSTADGLGPIWLRPYRAQDTSTNRDVFYIGTGDPMNPNSSTTNQRNYFYAVEDQTDIAGGESALPGGSGGVCPAAVLWSYYFDNFQKVLSDPVIIGNNIIVGVYVPPGGATGCGAPGYSKLYCFDRMTGSPNACLSSNTTTSSVDDPNPTSGGLRRWVKAGDGMLSDLAAVGNSVVYTTSTNPGVPVQKNVQNVNLPFRVRSWRRIQ
jgi:Tfp pilus tip-associated adhesin PilY1